MTISVTANPYSTPPRNEITVSVPTGDVMKTASLVRTVNGMTEPTRTQPATGFDSQIVYDYESPYDTSVSYTFTTTYTDPTVITTAWDETWASLSNWSGSTGSYTTSGGVLILTGTSGVVNIDRPMPAAGSYRAVISSISSSGTDANSVKVSGIAFLDASGTQILLVAPNLAGKITVKYGNGALNTTSISGASPVTVDFLGTSIVVNGTGGSYAFSNLTTTDYATIRVTTHYVTSGTFHLGEVKTSTYGTTTTITNTSPLVALSPVNAWMVHPSNPGLSLPISSLDKTALMIRAIGDVTNQSASTEHVILGQSAPIITTTGPRYSNRLQMVLGVRSRAQELALNALLSDGTPILFRFPGIMDTGFDEGFYSVGDAVRARMAQRPSFGLRDFTLPLVQVQAPVVTVQNAGWSFAGLASVYASFATLTAAYNSFADVVIDNRNSGY